MRKEVDDMDTRVYKLNIKRAGGNASKNAVAYKIDLPSTWLKIMGISPEERAVEISFDGNSIAIRKVEAPVEKQV